MDFKKMFPNKKVTQKKLLDFFDKKGFYIVLVLCIAAIGITAALVTAHNISSSGDYGSPPFNIADGETDENESSNYLALGEYSGYYKTGETGAISSTLEEIDGIIDTSGNIEHDDSAEAVQKPETTENSEPVKEETEEKTSEAKAQETVDLENSSTAVLNAVENSEEAIETFAMPVFGEVTLEYAMEQLVYSKTLEEWRAHSGIDLRADWGTPVKVVADGIVAEIKNDPRFGVTVVVEHGSGLKTLYANLADGDMVVPNQKVKRGDAVGSVGNTALIESAEPPHLHFEVIKDGKPVDPGGYLSLY